jgi:hypothetical protein
MMAFVEMRKILQANSGILQRMDHFELKMVRFLAYGWLY